MDTLRFAGGGFGALTAAPGGGPLQPECCKSHIGGAAAQGAGGLQDIRGRCSARRSHVFADTQRDGGWWLRGNGLIALARLN